MRAISGIRTTSPSSAIGGPTPVGHGPSACQSADARSDTAKPLSAASIASVKQESRPRRPNRSHSADQPATAPGTVIDRGPLCSTGSVGCADSGAGPAASNPV